MKFSTILLTAGIICSLSTIHAGEPFPVKGLKNVNNSCFINCAVQIIRTMPDLVHTLLSFDKGFYKEGSLSDLFVDLLKQMRDKKEADIDPTIFAIEAWKRLNIDAGKQVDANELISLLLHALTDGDIDPLWYSAETTELMTRQYSIETGALQFNMVSDYCEQQPLIKQNNLLLQVFSEDTTLRQCLNHNFEPTLEQSRVNDELIFVESQKYLAKTENYLMLSLERIADPFSGDNEHFLQTRQNNPLTFPLQGLTFDAYFENKQHSKGPYELIGIVMHGGTGLSGHYVSYVKSGNQWYYCNDSSVKPVNEEEISIIAQRGYGQRKIQVPTTLVYELSSARPTYPPVQRVRAIHLDDSSDLELSTSYSSSSSSSKGIVSKAGMAALQRKSILMNRNAQRAQARRHK